MDLVDAHCHFDFSAFDGQRGTIMSALHATGIDRLVIPAVREPDWGRIAALAASDEGLYYCLGVHPWFVKEHQTDVLDDLQARLSATPENCVGLGECGLDRLHGDLESQQWWFEAQVEMARDLDWPLVIHSVKTHDEVLATLKRLRFDGSVLIHGFSGSEQQARKLADFGACLGVGGVITYDRARKTRRAIARAPLGALVLETDAPDMPPAGVAKGDNSPVYLPRILEALQELRSEPRDELVEALRANVNRVYRW
ncbi:MAG: TatD family hydrolase [Oleiphilaceae bacterium]|nr:TatD family hydrolase [Oleiphilaceae bacterium]